MKKHASEKEKGNVFDKILKENIKQMIKPLAEELLQKSIKSIKPLPAKMQTTLEIESDDFNLVELVGGERIILHLEFEITLTKDMVYRVGEYHAVKQRKYKLPIYHFVLYLGLKRTNIRTRLKPDEVYHGFTLVFLNDKKPEEYLMSDIPELVIMAILGDYSDERKNEIVRLIISRLQTLINNNRKLKKYIDQLFILGRIRKLEPIITKNLENMNSIGYDITKDGLFIRGKKEGLEKGIKQSEKEIKKIKEKVERDKINGIKQLLLDGNFTQKRIAAIFNVTTSFVRKVKKELETEK